MLSGLRTKFYRMLVHVVRQLTSHAEHRLSVKIVSSALHGYQIAGGTANYIHVVVVYMSMRAYLLQCVLSDYCSCSEIKLYAICDTTKHCIGTCHRCV